MTKNLRNVTWRYVTLRNFVQRIARNNHLIINKRENTYDTVLAENSICSE